MKDQSSKTVRDYKKKKNICATIVKISNTYFFACNVTFNKLNVLNVFIKDFSSTVIIPLNNDPSSHASLAIYLMVL